MRRQLWLLIATASLLTACDGPSEIKIRTKVDTTDGVLKVVNGLQCPQTEDVLTRKGSASADGRSCFYAGPRGSEVELQLVHLGSETADSVLNTLEQRLSNDLPETTQALNSADTASQPSAPDRDKPSSDEGPSSSESASVKMPGLEVVSEGDRSTVRLPGMKIQSDGDRSEVRIGGIIIRSDSRQGSNQVRMTSQSSDGISIDDTSTGTRVRALAKGESVRASFRLVTKAANSRSWRSVGYDARGPAGGPIVIAIVRSRADNDDRVFDAAKELVRLNVGN